MVTAQHIENFMTVRWDMFSGDEWSGFAALLANLIEKYAVVLNLDALPNLVIEEAVPEKDGADEMIHENDIEPAKAA